MVTLDDDYIDPEDFSESVRTFTRYLRGLDRPLTSDEREQLRALYAFLIDFMQANG